MLKVEAADTNRDDTVQVKRALWIPILSEEYSLRHNTNDIWEAKSMNRPARYENVDWKGLEILQKTYPSIFFIIG